MSVENSYTLLKPDQVYVAIRFVKVAEIDLEASKVLLENKLYPQALFMLQQAIEKAAKAVMYAMTRLSIEELKRGVSHEVLRRGLSIATEHLVEEFRNQLQGWLFQPANINILCACNEVRQLFTEIMEKFVETKGRIEETIRKINSYADKLSSLALRQLEDNVRSTIDDFINMVSQIMHDPVSHLPIEISSLPGKLQKAFMTCLRGISKNRDQWARIEAMVKRRLEEIVEGAVRGIYLLSSYVALVTLHGFFERNISLLRYPDEKWTPLSLSEDIAIVYLASRILDFFKKTALLQTLREFLEGKIETEESREIYSKIYKHLMSIITVS